MSLTDEKDLELTGAKATAGSTDENAAGSSTVENSDDDNTAASSSADTGEKSLTDVVFDALDDGEASPTSETGTDAAEAADETDVKDTEQKTAEDGKDDESELSEQEMAGLNEKTRRRIDVLLGQRKAHEQDAVKAREEVETYRKDAESHHNVQSFMRENNVTAKDAGQALHLAALINNDPIAAHAQLKPIMDQLAKSAGAVLPQDLMAAVQRGEITQARAQELSKLQATQRNGEVNAERNRQAEAQRVQNEKAQKDRDDQTTHVQNMATLADKWAAEQAQTDPDWELKQDLVAEKTKLDIYENGMPKDDADLRKRMGAIRDQVTKDLRNLAPSIKPSRKVLASTGSSGKDVTPPASAEDAVFRVLN